MSLNEQEPVAKNGQNFPVSNIGAMPPIPSIPEVRVSGLKIPGIFNAEWIKGMKDMKWKPDDIWIVTYPKCGTTWAQ